MMRHKLGRNRLEVLVPRLVDAGNRNAQNLNAKALLARFQSENVLWHTFYYDEPDESIARRENVRCHALRKGRLWTWDAIFKYQGNFDGIFYPGNEWFDARALGLRRTTGRRIPVVSTLEGVPGDDRRESELSAKMQCAVRCYRPRSGSAFTRSHDSVRRHTDLLIAISPFLREVGQHLYEAQPIDLPLGVDSSIFNASGRRDRPSKPVVVGAGTLYAAKRAEVFLQLASEFPGVDFVWYGDGPLHDGLVLRATQGRLWNLRFPGAVAPAELASRFRESSIFVLPSLSEGVPKVTLEAAACGLPVVLFGHYRAPNVLHDRTGFVVWTDDELRQSIARLIADPGLCEKMGTAAASLSLGASWNAIAADWEAPILDFFRNHAGL